MTERRALVVGEALIDEYPDGRFVAGAPLHVAAHLVALGWKAAMVTRVGRDPDGASIVRAMKAAGIATDLVETDDTLRTGTTRVDIMPDGSHTFTVERPVAWDAIVGPDPVPGHDVVVFGTLALRDPKARRAIERIAADSGFVAVDLNLRPPHYSAETLAAALASASLVKATTEEETQVKTLLNIASLFEFGATWVCLTRGADGASLHNRSGHVWDVPGKRVDAVDTVGAGDAFLAGLIDGLTDGAEPSAALRRATELAADTLQHRGGMPRSDTE